MTKFVRQILSIIESPKLYVPVITLLLAIFLINASNKVIKKILIKNSKTLEIKRRNTIVVLIQNIIKYLILILAFLICLRVWGIDVTGIIAGLGVAGLVGGLALQDALKDIIMGCNIILDNYFVVGDLVRFNDFTGEVIEFGLKNTKIKGADGTVYVVANREISKIFNLSQKTANVIVMAPASYENTEEEVAKVMRDICAKIDSWDDTLDKTEYLGIDSLNDSAVNYCLRAFCKGENQFVVRRRILALIKREFEANNIKIPYSQIEVHNGKRI